MDVIFWYVGHIPKNNTGVKHRVECHTKTPHFNPSFSKLNYEISLCNQGLQQQPVPEYMGASESISSLLVLLTLQEHKTHQCSAQTSPAQENKYCSISSTLATTNATAIKPEFFRGRQSRDGHTTGSWAPLDKYQPGSHTCAPLHSTGANTAHKLQEKQSQEHEESPFE